MSDTPTKVYVVSAGEHSDYRVVGIFSTLEKAKSYIGAFDDDRYSLFNDIVEWEVDHELTGWEQGYRAWSLRMAKDGSASDLKIINPADALSACARGEFYPWSEGMYVTCFAKDEEHAVKIANEIRAQKIATNQWGKP